MYKFSKQTVQMIFHYELNIPAKFKKSFMEELFDKHEQMFAETKMF